MSIKRLFTPCGISAIAAVALLSFGLPGRAMAQTCIEDITEDNDPNRVPLGCTANDFGVGSVTVTQLIDGCNSEGDSFTFNGVLNITAESGGAADRNDIAFYIGADGEQALRGTCARAVLPTGRCSGGDGTTACFTNTDCSLVGGSCSPLPAPNTGPNDGDQCGDYVGDSEVHAAITNVTAVCADGDGDGFFDLAICTSYDNNAGGTCNGIDDAFPSTKSKCRCSTVNTDQEIPHCDVNADCTTDNNVCTDEVCLGLGEPGADFFGCGHVNNTVNCDDNLFCNGTDTCSGGVCTHAGDPCPSGSVCSSCNEAGDTCSQPQGTVCRPANGICDVQEVCDGTSTSCPGNGFNTGNVCRAAASVCDVQEVCSGTSASCPGDSVAPTTTVCRGSAGICDIAENCNGTSGTCPGDGFVGTATVCRQSAGQCDLAENCSGTAAACPGNGFASTATSCNDGLFCNVNEVCDGNGNCAGGTPQNCDDGVDCTDDLCDEEANSCDSTPDDAFCDDGDECTEDICSPQSGCISDLICADICRSPGYWKNHAGVEKDGAINVTQELLNIVGPLSVCGQTLSATSNEEAPFMEGLGLTSTLQGLCVRTKGVHQRSLYRQLVAAALNCAASGEANTCDDILDKYIDVTFAECSAVCAGTAGEDAPSENECKSQLDCFNNGGQWINGSCATGTCAEQPEITCGGDHGDCPLFNALPQECVNFENNCHDQEMCNEELDFCPKKTPAASQGACREARSDECTIDSCD